MYDTKHLTSAATLKDAGDEAGQLEAIISTFGVVDSDGDVVEQSAFTEGQEVPLVWDHQWDRPVGKGTITTTPNHAIFRGRFFMDTAAGQEAYKTVKAMGTLQEYSWGFRLLDTDFAERDGREVRVIKGTEVYEASPTLVGANRQTGTLSIKSGDSFAADADSLAAALAAFTKRTQARAEMRAKAGRVLSSANRDRLAAHLQALQQACDDIEAILAATAPQPTEDGKGAHDALLEFLAFEARRHGVAV